MSWRCPEEIVQFAVQNGHNPDSDPVDLRATATTVEVTGLIEDEGDSDGKEGSFSEKKIRMAFIRYYCNFFFIIKLFKLLLDSVWMLNNIDQYFFSIKPFKLHWSCIESGALKWHLIQQVSRQVIKWHCNFRFTTTFTVNNLKSKASIKLFLEDGVIHTKLYVNACIYQ